MGSIAWVKNVKDAAWRRTNKRPAPKENGCVVVKWEVQLERKNVAQDEAFIHKNEAIHF